MVFYLANGNYSQTRFCRDVDLILTDSWATADRYRRQLGIGVVPVGKFIDPAGVVALNPSRERILFVNPTLVKGAAVVIRLALMLERHRPDIIFEVVESRAKWAAQLLQVSTAFGEARESLSNVVVTPNTPDMKPVYGRARLLLAPSLWWESGARVLAEAMLNGIPAITTDHGGSAEMVKDGGIVLKLNDCCYQNPYSSVPSCQTLMPLVERLEALFDNPAYYADLAVRAKRVGQEQHHLDVSTQRLLHALQPLVEQRAGDLDVGALMVKQHRHGVDDRSVATVAQKPS